MFIDYENVHRTGHGRYAGIGQPRYETVVNPVMVAERIVGRRKLPGVLHAIYVYRGRPSPQYQPEPTRANDAQAAAWERDRRVRMTRRALKYTDNDDGTYRAQEKGIDVSVAIGLVAGAIKDEFEVAIVFSSDTDLMPAVSLAFRSTKVRVEIACWSGAKPLWLPEELAATPRRQLPYCHFLSEDDFFECRDRTFYG